MHTARSISQIEGDLRKLIQQAWVEWTGWIIYEAWKRGMTLGPIDGEDPIDPEHPPSAPEAAVQERLQAIVDAIVAERYTRACAEARARGEAEPSIGTIESVVLGDLWDGLRAHPATVYLSSTVAVPYDRGQSLATIQSNAAPSRRDLIRRAPVVIGAIVASIVILWITWTGWWSPRSIGNSEPVPSVQINNRTVTGRVRAVVPDSIVVTQATVPILLCLPDDIDPPPSEITVTWDGYAGTTFQTVYRATTESTDDRVVLTDCRSGTVRAQYTAAQWVPILGQRDDLTSDLWWEVGTESVTVNVRTVTDYTTVALRLPNGQMMSATDRQADESGVRWTIVIQRASLERITTGAIWATHGSEVFVQSIPVIDVRDEALVDYVIGPPHVRVIRPTIGPLIAEITMRSSVAFPLRDGMVVQRVDGQDVPTMIGTIPIPAYTETTVRIPLHERATHLRLGDRWLVTLSRP